MKIDHVTQADKLWADLKVTESERDISARILAHVVGHAATLKARLRWAYIEPSLQKFQRDEAAYDAALAAFKAETRGGK